MLNLAAADGVQLPVCEAKLKAATTGNDAKLDVGVRVPVGGMAALAE